jgi:hypothetical protein
LTTAAEIIAALRNLDSADRMKVIIAAATMDMETKSAPAKGDDELVDIDAAVRMLGLSASFLYHQKLPFIVKIGRRRMFSRAGIQRYIRTKQGSA